MKKEWITETWCYYYFWFIIFNLNNKLIVFDANLGIRFIQFERNVLKKA